MDLEIDIKDELIWPEETANTSLDSELNNGVDNGHFMKIEPQTAFITPVVENDAFDSRTKDDVMDSELNNGVDNGYFVKVDPQTAFITPVVENDAFDSRTKDDVMNLKEETCDDDDEDNFGDTRLYDDGTSLLSTFADDTMAEPEKIFLKEVAKDSFHTSDGSRSSPSRLSPPTGKKTFPCSLCSKVYRRKICLWRHELEHCERSRMAHISDGSRSSPSRLSAPTGKKTFPCSLCSKVYARKIHLERHEYLHCERSRMARPRMACPRMACTFCNRTYNRRADFESHLEMHSGVRSHKCDICNKKFTWRQSLRKHMIIQHSAKHLYACNICPESYQQPGDLQKHLEVHTSKNSQMKTVTSHSYVCNICSKAYGRRRSLVTHMVVHDVAKHECSVCHKKFKWLKSLKMHLMIHTESKPYPCKKCSKAFRRPSVLREHMLKHSAESEFSLTEAQERRDT